MPVERCLLTGIAKPSVPSRDAIDLHSIVDDKATENEYHEKLFEIRRPSLSCVTVDPSELIAKIMGQID